MRYPQERGDLNMARVIRKTDPSITELGTMINDLKDFVVTRDRQVRADLVSIASDSVAFATPALVDAGAHNDVSEVLVTSADADGGDDDDGLAGSLTLLNEILAWYAFHMADTLAHKVVGVALASYAKASSLATAVTRANDIKSKYNTHRAATTYHYTADSTNVVTATDASGPTDLAGLILLLNDIKAQLNAHAISGVSAKSVRLVDA